MPRKKSTQDETNASGGMGDFGSAINQLCEEKGISKEKVIETIEAALAAAYKKDYGKKGQNIRAKFDEVSGKTKFYLVKEVVDETTREFVTEEDLEKEREKNPGAPVFFDGEATERIPRYNMERDLTLEEAKAINPEAVLGDTIETELPEERDYGRVAAQTAKQVIIQRIREAERDLMYSEYKNKEGEVINGVVQRIEGRNVFVDIGKSAGVLFPTEQIERDNYRIGQRIKVYVFRVDAGTKGPGVSLSRVHPEMVRKMFELEVPEIFAGTVEIKAIAREAGERTKIAVSSNEEGIDPIGSCVGQKGTRVQAIIEELGGEKIDIILWNEDVAKFISASLSPAKVLRVDLNEEQKKATVLVPEEQLSLAIGKRGQNVRLAAKLTGWKIDISGVKSEEEEDAEDETENETKAPTEDTIPSQEAEEKDQADGGEEAETEVAKPEEEEE